MQQVIEFNSCHVVAIDGCAYGPNFPMEFFIHFPHFLQCGSLQTYEPKLYGMAISEESPAYREGRYIKNHSKDKKNIEQTCSWKCLFINK